MRFKQIWTGYFWQSGSHGGMRRSGNPASEISSQTMADRQSVRRLGCLPGRFSTQLAHYAGLRGDDSANVRLVRENEAAGAADAAAWVVAAVPAPLFITAQVAAKYGRASRPGGRPPGRAVKHPVEPCLEPRNELEA